MVKIKLVVVVVWGCAARLEGRLSRSRRRGVLPHKSDGVLVACVAGV